MAKIHTHYDNLKVARLAPQEVIRAAYKALSQKYHPDKNPGDEKAARIMAILNSAYTTLADPQRRREHDEWIAAEEWEIEWLESTRGEEQRDKAPHEFAPRDIEPAPAPRRGRRRRLLAAALCLALALGWAAGALTPARPLDALAARWAGRPGPRAAAPAAAQPPGAQKDDAAPDPWALAKASAVHHGGPKPPDIKVATLAQLVLSPGVPDCDGDAPLLTAPNGDPWPGATGYLDGFIVGNSGDDLQVLIDNGNNDSAVFIKLFDTERRANVRYVFIRAHDKFTIDKLAQANYEVRYQNLDAGAAGRGGCDTPKRNAAEQ